MLDVPEESWSNSHVETQVESPIPMELFPMEWFPKQKKKKKMISPGLTVHGNSYEILEHQSFALLMG
jgi:hypothetical protein